MEDLLAIQLRATDALMEGEQEIDRLIGLISDCFIGEEKELLEHALRELTKTCISFGRLQSTHERYLK